LSEQISDYRGGQDRVFHYPGRKTILCIDDDDGMLDYQRVLLERRGYAVLTAASARQSLQIAAACAIVAVIVDYHMPEMNGHEVATEIKRLTPQIPIVMLQRRGDSSTRAEGGGRLRFQERRPRLLIAGDHSSLR
jgi:CheY-like chemotaxis protein